MQPHTTARKLYNCSCLQYAVTMPTAVNLAYCCELLDHASLHPVCQTMHGNSFRGHFWECLDHAIVKNAHHGQTTECLPSTPLASMPGLTGIRACITAVWADAAPLAASLGGAVRTYVAVPA